MIKQKKMINRRRFFRDILFRRGYLVLVVILLCGTGMILAKGKQLIVTQLPNGVERRHVISRSPHDGMIKMEVIEDYKDKKLIRREESQWPWKQGSWLKKTTIEEYDEQGRKTLIGEISELKSKNTKHSRFAHYTLDIEGSLKEERVEIAKVSDDEDYAWTEIYAYFPNGKIRIRQIPIWNDLAVVGVKNTLYTYFDGEFIKNFRVRKYNLSKKLLSDKEYSYNRDGSFSTEAK